MATQVPEIVSTALGEIRAKAASWDGLDPNERRRLIRDHLTRQADAVSVEPSDFAQAVLAAIPSSETAAAPALAPAPAPVPEPEPRDPVEHIIERMQALSPVDRRRLVERMRALDMLPTIPQIVVPVAPVPPAAVAPKPVEPPPQPVQPPAPVRVAASSGVAIGDEALLALAAGFGIAASAKRGTTIPIAEIEAMLARQGLKRAQITADALAIALGHLAKGIASVSEEGERNANGLPEAIRAVLPNSRRDPVDQLKNYLSGVVDADKFHDYVDEYFEPYRQLSRRLPDLCFRLKTVADKLSPRDCEAKVPKSWSGPDYKKLWEVYSERHAGYVKQGLGGTVESTRVWLMQQWLN